MSTLRLNYDYYDMMNSANIGKVLYSIQSIPYLRLYGEAMMNVNRYDVIYIHSTLNSPYWDING